MERLEYPNSAKNFLRQMLTMFASGFVSFVAVMVGAQLGSNTLSLLGALMFGLSIVGGLLSILWKIKHKKCPKCQSPMKSRADYSTSRWVATCAQCNVEWDLGIGCDPTSP